MTDKSGQLLAYLARRDDWTPASELAEHLGVSTRTVRNYVTALKVAAAPLEVISSSPEGYRLDPQAHAEYVEASRREGAPQGPRERVAFLVTRLTQSPTGIDVFELTESLHVSESTIDADLRRVRSLARDAGLVLTRDGSVVRLDGPEEAHRRLVSRMFQQEQSQGMIDIRRVQEAFGIGDLRAFKTDVIQLLESHGYAVNEFGLDRVLLHTAIAVERARGAAPTEGARPEHPLAGALDELVARHFDARLPGGEVAALASLLATRVGTRLDPEVGRDHLEVLRRITERAQEEFLVELDDDDFLLRLSLHVGNLVARARDGIESANPLARTIKSSYPLTYELAVFIASEIQREFDIAIGDDEIAFIALHIGSHLERHGDRGARLGATLVAPGYHDLAELLERRVVAAVGEDVRIDAVVSRTDVSPGEFPSDLVVSTIPWEVRPPNVVIVQPIPTDADLDAVRGAVARIRRQRRRRAIADELLRYFDDALFFRNVAADDEESVIRLLGGRMLERGIIDEAYLEACLERERLSSTAFTESLAVPHSMSMTAARTAIAIALNDVPLRWGDAAVNVVALVAFSVEGRAAFQTVFEQFVDVFSDRADVQRLLRSATDFPSFIDELVHLIDD